MMVGSKAAERKKGGEKKEKPNLGLGQMRDVQRKRSTGTEQNMHNAGVVSKHQMFPKYRVAGQAVT